MHAILTISVLHQGYLVSPSSTPTRFECYHWSRTVLLFNRKLDSSIAEEDRDAVFATGALMSGISFAWTETSQPRCSWPMISPPETDCLRWLQIPRGLKLLISIARPFRRGSIFHTHSHDSDVDVNINDSVATFPAAGLRNEHANLPLQLANLCSTTSSLGPAT